MSPKGGFRPGSGPKPVAPEKKLHTVATALDIDGLDWLQRRKHARGVRSVSEVIREIIVAEMEREGGR